MPVLAELQQDFTLAAPMRWTPVVVAAARVFKSLCRCDSRRARMYLSQPSEL